MGDSEQDLSPNFKWYLQISVCLANIYDTSYRWHKVSTKKKKKGNFFEIRMDLINAKQSILLHLPIFEWIKSFFRFCENCGVKGKRDRTYSSVVKSEKLFRQLMKPLEIYFNEVKVKRNLLHWTLWKFYYQLEKMALDAKLSNRRTMALDDYWNRIHGSNTNCWERMLIIRLEIICQPDDDTSCLFDIKVYISNVFFILKWPNATYLV